MILLYVALAILGLVVLFFGTVYLYGISLAINEGIRSFLGMPPKSIHSFRAMDWIWVDGKAIRKATHEEWHLQSIHGAYSHKQGFSIDDL